MRVKDDTPIRDFLSVSAAVSALSQILKRYITGVFNVGSGIGTSINALVKLLLAIANQINREIVATKASSRRSKSVLDISETVKAIDWVPSPSLQGQLKKYLQARELKNDQA